MQFNANFPSFKPMQNVYLLSNNCRWFKWIPGVVLNRFGDLHYEILYDGKRIKRISIKYDNGMIRKQNTTVRPNLHDFNTLIFDHHQIMFSHQVRLTRLTKYSITTRLCSVINIITLKQPWKCFFIREKILHHNQVFMDLTRREMNINEQNNVDAEAESNNSNQISVRSKIRKRNIRFSPE